MLPELIAHLTFLGVPNKYPIHLVSTVGMSSTAQMSTGGLQVGTAAGNMATNL